MTWLDDYTAWASHRSPLTPKHFHANIGLSLIAGATAGRVIVRLPHERLTPNLWTLIVAKTSVYAKSTAFKVAQELVDLTMQEKTFNSVSTPEALLSEFSGAKPSNLNELDAEKQKLWVEGARWGARRLLMMDESGRFFNALQREYNQTLDAIMMEAYDATGKQITRQTMKQGLIVVNHACLSCLFATTPANIKTLLSAGDQWSSGWWVRWNFVTSNEMTDWRVSEALTPPPELVTTLKKISRVVFERYTDKPHEAFIDKDVLGAYNVMTEATRNAIHATDDEKLHGVLGRLPTKRLKAALLFAIMDNAFGKVHIKMHHWEQAEELVQSWTQDAQLAITLSAHSDRMTLEEKVISIVRSHHNAQGITARRIQQLANRTAQEIDGILQTFIRNGTIIAKESGRTKVFLLAVPEPIYIIAETQNKKSSVVV